MYQIASMLPQWTNYLDADGYFERAVQTTYAYFKYPYEILPWFETYKWGIYNERFIPEIIAELEIVLTEQLSNPLMHWQSMPLSTR